MAWASYRMRSLDDRYLPVLSPSWSEGGWNSCSRHPFTTVKQQGRYLPYAFSLTAPLETGILPIVAGPYVVESNYQLLSDPSCCATPVPVTITRS